MPTAAAVLNPSVSGGVEAQPSSSAVTELPNGIQIPSRDWPPRGIPLYNGSPQETARFQGDPSHLISRRTLPVPYLSSPPYSRILRNAAGLGGRQLFVDDFLIESTTMTRVWYKPTETGVVLAPDGTGRPWEVNGGDTYTMCFSGGINYDSGAGIYKYHYYAHPDATGYAESVTGLPGTATFPNLGDGTNRCKRWLDLATGHDSDAVHLDLYETDPNKKWKMSATRLNPGVAWYQDIHYSADGKTWAAKAAQTGNMQADRTTVHFNDFYNAVGMSPWVWSMRNLLGPASNPRYRGFWLTRTFDTGFWSDPNNYDYPQSPNSPVNWAMMTGQDWSRHDATNAAFDVDAGGSPGVVATPQMYALDGCPYESGMVFAIAKYEGGPVYLGRPKFNEILFAFSRDGFHYTVGHDRTPFISMSTVAQNWRWGNVQPANPFVIVDQGSLRMHVSGRAGIVGQNLESGACSTGLFGMRRDGFCSMSAPSGAGEKTLDSPRSRFYSGTKFFVNARPTGPSPQLRTEFRHYETGAVFPNFARSNSSVVSADTTWSEMTWSGGTLTNLTGEPLRIRFYAQDMEIFSYGFTNNSGDAGGFIRQGRP